MSYRDEAGSVRMVPLSWTDRKVPDMFCEQSAGRSVLHVDDIEAWELFERALIERIRAARSQRGFARPRRFRDGR